MNTHDSAFSSTNRRKFLQTVGLGASALGLPSQILAEPPKPIQGFEKVPTDPKASKKWKPVSDRKIRVGIAGYGLCQFGAGFGFQDHPNVDVAAVTDLFPDRCAGLAKACRCHKTYPSLEEMIKDDTIEAVFVATDAPSHARHCIEALRRGKHVGCCVPAVWGSLEDADELFQAVKASGKRYMMFETTAYYAECIAMRRIYEAGGFGKILYTEGEYFHYTEQPLPSYKGWREGGPPQWYPTHSNAFYSCVTGGSFTEVSCMGIPSKLDWLKPENNRYRNPFGTEIALFRTSDGGMARMGVSWDTPGAGGEKGRIRGVRGSFYGHYEGLEKNLPLIERPPLPPGVEYGGHDGSHGPLMDEFVTAILEDRKPLVDVAQALNMTVAGVVAHQSALRHGELLKVPQFKL